MTSTTLQWKKGFFKCAFKIYKAGEAVGKLIESPWSQSAKGELNNKKLDFKVKNAWMPWVEIVDCETRQTIGQIKFSCWWSKAIVQYHNKLYKWRYANWWNTKWHVTDEQGNKVGYMGHSHRGQITSGIEDEGLLLTGLFIGNYFWQMTTIYIVAILFPLLFFAY